MIPTCSKHSSNISVSFVESLLHDSVNKWRSVEEKSFVALPTVLISYLATTVAISFPQSSIANFLDLWSINRFKGVQHTENQFNPTFKTL